MVDQQRGALDKGAGGGDVLGHVGQHPLEPLIVEDRLAELAPFAGVTQCCLQPCLCDADSQRGDADAALLQHAHHDVEAAPLRTEQRLARNRDAVEIERADLARALAHLVLLRPARDARCMEIAQEDAHAAMAGGGIGRGQHEAEIGDRCVMNPELAAIDDIALGRFARRGANVGEIGAGLRLG